MEVLQGAVRQTDGNCPVAITFSMATFRKPLGNRYCLGCSAEISLNDQFRNHLELRALTFPHDASRPSAQYLGTLLQTTSMHEIHYELYSHQCYSFAYTVFESLQMLHPTSISNDRHHKNVLNIVGAIPQGRKCG